MGDGSDGAPPPGEGCPDEPVLDPMVDCSPGAALPCEYDMFECSCAGAGQGGPLYWACYYDTSRFTSVDGLQLAVQCPAAGQWSIDAEFDVTMDNTAGMYSLIPRVAGLTVQTPQNYVTVLVDPPAADEVAPGDVGTSHHVTTAPPSYNPYLLDPCNYCDSELEVTVAVGLEVPDAPWLANTASISLGTMTIACSS